MRTEINSFQNVNTILFTDTKEQVIEKLEEQEIYYIRERELSFRKTRIIVYFDENNICEGITVSNDEIEIFVNQKLISANFQTAFKQLKKQSTNYKEIGDYEKNFIFYDLGVSLYLGIEDVEEDEHGNENIIYCKEWNCIEVFSRTNNLFLKSKDIDNWTDLF